LDPLELTSRGTSEKKYLVGLPASETFRRLKCDHDFIWTSGACFHSDHQIRNTGGSRVETQASEVETWEGTMTEREPEDATATGPQSDEDSPAHSRDYTTS